MVTFFLLVAIFLLILVLGIIVFKLLKKGTAGSKTEALGYFSLGVLTDYFVFKPVRATRSAILIGIGFGLGFVFGVISVVGIEKIANLFY